VRYLFRFLRTVRYLRFIQIVNKIKRMIFQPRLINLEACLDFRLSNRSPAAFSSTNPKSILGENNFRFLNVENKLEFPGGWNRLDIPLLWMYNLHYHAGLLNNGTSDDLKRKFVMNWILDNSASPGIGWQPYPLSLRIVNWIKWIWTEKSEVPEEVYASLFQQTKYLFKTLEYHLLGNHLLENAKALVFAGYFYEGPEAEAWLTKGLSILEVELQEQILDDGGHFELSPMYHSLILDLVLDILQLANTSKANTALADQLKNLSDIASKMSKWLATMCHPDGEISFFNDAAIGISQPPEDLLDRSFQQVAIDSPLSLDGVTHLDSSGYVRLANSNAVVFLDVADVGASYLPGHGHADALALEFSLFKQRLFVNTGTSEYGNGTRRHYERSTAAHSTVEIEGQNSSEIWSGFRVGRRSQVKNVTFFDSCSVSAEHDGYRYIAGSPVHRRTVSLGDKAFIVEDNVDSCDINYLARFHLHPDIEILLFDSKNSGYFIFPDGVKVTWKSECDDVSIEANYYAEGFGKLSPMKTLALHRKLSGKTKLVVNWP